MIFIGKFTRKLGDCAGRYRGKASLAGLAFFASKFILIIGVNRDILREIEQYF